MTALEAGLAGPKIPGLDGLRAIAVFLVILNHFGWRFVPGGLGVLMFFVISGFLITWLLMKEYEKRGAVSLRRFYARRALRIFPAFYCYALVYLGAMAFLGKTVNWPQAAAALFYVSNYFQALMGDPGTGLSHSWSLAIEEQFYLLWPPLFVWLAGRGRWLRMVPVALIVMAWVYRAVLQFGVGVWQGYFYEAFDARFDHLLVGCVLGIVLFQTRKHEAWRVLDGNSWMLVVAVGLLAGSVWCELRFGTDYRDSLGFIFNPLFAAALIPLVISLRGAALAVWLDWKPVRYLGSISYSLYLYQQFILPSVRRVLEKCPVGIQLAAALVLLVGVASASYWLVEKPFLRWKDRAFHA